MKRLLAWTTLTVLLAAGAAAAPSAMAPILTPFQIGQNLPTIDPIALHVEEQVTTPDKRDFFVVFGRYPRSGVGVVEGSVLTEGAGLSTKPIWSTNDGVSFLVGFFPVIQTEEFQAGGEGTTILCWVEKNGTPFPDYWVYLLEGTQMTITLNGQAPRSFSNNGHPYHGMWKVFHADGRWQLSERMRLPSDPKDLRKRAWDRAVNAANDLRVPTSSHTPSGTE